MPQKSFVNLRSPIVWFGGKGQLASRIVALFPRHHIYVEPFGGGASVLFRKQPSPVEVYNDLDTDLVNLFRVLREPELFARFYRLIEHTPYSRAIHQESLERLQEAADPAERAWRWYVVARQSFSGVIGKSWGFSVTSTNRGRAEAASKWQSAILSLPSIHERMMDVQIECDDGVKVLKRYDTQDTLFYCDPPYVHSTRKSGGYRHEMDDEQHAQLIQALCEAKGTVILSGYRSELHGLLEKDGWARCDLVHQLSVSHNRASMRSKFDSPSRDRRVESIWLNPTCWRRLAGENRLPKKDGKLVRIIPARNI